MADTSTGIVQTRTRLGNAALFAWNRRYPDPRAFRFNHVPHRRVRIGSDRHAPGTIPQMSAELPIGVAG